MLGVIRLGMSVKSREGVIIYFFWQTLGSVFFGVRFVNFYFDELIYRGLDNFWGSFSLVLMYLGRVVKLGIFPICFWIPKVYENLD